MSRWRVKRIGQDESKMKPSEVPCYTLVQELTDSFIVEYCGAWKVLPKTAYCLVS